MEAKYEHTHRLRVRYQETDQMGVVYHANYLNWMEVGRTEWIRAKGMPYRQLEEKGLLLPVIDLQVQYRQPARYDDWVAITTRVTGYSNLKLDFEYELRREPEPENETAAAHRDGATAAGDASIGEGEVLLTGSTRHLWVNTAWKPIRLDRAAPELYELLGSLGIPRV